MAGRSGPRNSSVELLRILSMLMIVASHCVMFSDMNLLAQPLGVNKILIETFLYPGGKIGVVAFFSISAWYLSEAGGVRAGLRRVWILEREMLFWSLTLLAVTAVVNRSLVGPELAVRSLMPITTSLWWYPTAYAVFLLFFPFLTQGLRSLGKTAHGALCTIMVVLYTVLDMVMPLSAVGLPGGNVRSFIYIYTLIAYYRWYMKPLTTATVVDAGRWICADRCGRSRRRAAVPAHRQIADVAGLSGQSGVPFAGADGRIGDVCAVRAARIPQSRGQCGRRIHIRRVPDFGISHGPAVDMEQSMARLRRVVPVSGRVRADRAVGVCGVRRMRRAGRGAEIAVPNYDR